MATSITFIVKPEMLMTAAQMREEKINLLKLGLKNGFESLAWCASRHLIKNGVLCDLCHINKNLIKRSNRIDEHFWHCKKCGHSSSVREGSIFVRTKKSMSQILIIIYGYSHDFSLKQIQIESSLSDGTIVEWFNFCREICTKHLQQHPVEIGGFDENGEPTTVEIDLHRKYHRGADDEQWIFGGVERNSGRLFVTPVVGRSEETLLPIVSRISHTSMAFDTFAKCS
ncbi:uncharacterized protein [Diabrotica undecimpunctata]|uniref:uncharacterized protein isoform X2 n=1 Tax=Diabrotica undecimpunctata TaxID=50387 RepID=UPI003B634ABB